VWRVTAINPKIKKATSGPGHIKIKRDKYVHTRDISRYHVGQVDSLGAKDGVWCVIAIKPRTKRATEGPGVLTIKRSLESDEKEGLLSPLVQHTASGDSGPMLLHIPKKPHAAGAGAAKQPAEARPETFDMRQCDSVEEYLKLYDPKLSAASAAAVASTAAREAMALAAAPVVVFDPAHGLPLNEAACEYCAAMWNTDVAAVAPPPLHDLRFGNLVSYAQLRIATGKFAQRNLIGDGGSCRVYKAQVYGVDVAVKVITENNSRTAQRSLERKTAAYNLKQFNAETKLLQSVNHAHVIRLLATCDDGPTPALLLEFMDGGACDRRTANKKKPVLHWKDRLTVTPILLR
jgi:hypothetical protein